MTRIFIRPPDAVVDVAVVGGGAAGLSGALMLVRSRRSVVVIDSGSPRNAPAGSVHGLLGHDGVPPAELHRKGREEVCGYASIVVDDGEVTSAVRAPTTRLGAQVGAKSAGGALAGGAHQRRPRHRGHDRCPPDARPAGGGRRPRRLRRPAYARDIVRK